MMYSWHETSQGIHVCKALMLKFSCAKSLFSGQSLFYFSYFLMGNLEMKAVAETFECQAYLLLLVDIWLRHVYDK